jgi:hypothetical protein
VGRLADAVGLIRERREQFLRGAGLAHANERLDQVRRRRVRRRVPQRALGKRTPIARDARRPVVESQPKLEHDEGVKQPVLPVQPAALGDLGSLVNVSAALVRPPLSSGKPGEGAQRFGFLHGLS